MYSLLENYYLAPFEPKILINILIGVIAGDREGFTAGGLLPLPGVVDAVGRARVILLLLVRLLQPDLTLHAEKMGHIMVLIYKEKINFIYLFMGLLFIFFPI